MSSFRILLSLLALCWAGLAGPAGATLDTEALADVFSTAELAEVARGVPVGGSLMVSGLRLSSADGSEHLDLERFRVFAADARIVVHGDEGEESLQAPENAYFRGRVAGDPDSIAVLSVTPSGRVRGIVQAEGTTYLLGPQPAAGKSSGTPDGPLEAVAVDEMAKADAPGFSCDNRELPGVAEAQALASSSGWTAAAAARETPVAAKAAVTPHTARIALETDWEYYQLFGNTTDATDYAGDLIAFTSTVYDAEIETDMEIAHLSLWSSSSDPWDEFGTVCLLYEFGKYWNDNNSGIDRTLAHFLSGKGNGGGVAWIGVLCGGPFNVNIGNSCGSVSGTSNYGGDYGVSGDLDGNFDASNPGSVWDIVVVSHEIGHNFDSPHTHCYEGLGGSSSAVDPCYGSESGASCYSGTTGYPSGCAGGGQGCGTIMSYCHFLSGGLGNISLTLGEGHGFGVLPGRVPDRMRAHVESAAAGNPACLARVNLCTEDLLLDSNPDNGTADYSVCGTITAGGGYGVDGSGDVSFTAGTVVLTDGFYVASGGSLRIDT